MRFISERFEERVPCYRVLDDNGQPFTESSYVQVCLLLPTILLYSQNTKQGWCSSFFFFFPDYEFDSDKTLICFLLIQSGQWGSCLENIQLYGHSSNNGHYLLWSTKARKNFILSHNNWRRGHQCCISSSIIFWRLCLPSGIKHIQLLICLQLHSYGYMLMHMS